MPGAGQDSDLRFPLRSDQHFELRAYLLGDWKVARTMLDRAAGLHGTFAGVVRFTDIDGGRIRFREEGIVRWNTAGTVPFTGPASREYLLRPAATPDIMDMYFPDGRPFHRIGFGAHDHQDSHWCDPDTYRVGYTGVGPDEFHYRWDVSGPAKDLLLESVLHRAASPAAVGTPKPTPKR